MVKQLEGLFDYLRKNNDLFMNSMDLEGEIGKSNKHDVLSVNRMEQYVNMA